MRRGPTLPSVCPPFADRLAALAGRVAEARKLVLRAIDSKLSQQEPGALLAALEIADKLCGNILSNPSEPKYLRFRANNPSISKKLLGLPGGIDLLRALGFKTTVCEFEEFWIVEQLGSAQLRVLSEGREVIANYLNLARTKLEAAAREKQQKLASQNEARKMTLAEIEADKAERKDRTWR